LSCRRMAPSAVAACVPPFVQAYLAALSYEGTGFSAPSVARLVEQSPEFHAIRSRIRDKFREDFADAEDFVTVYDRCASPPQPPRPPPHHLLARA
jgi:hypothetical protein